MSLGLTAIDEFLKNLDNKARYYVVDMLLPTLARWQLEKVNEKSEKLIGNILLEQETSYLYDIREVNSNYYAYIKRMGREYPNLYLGVMRFRKGKTYRITHKTNGKEKIVRGLGLEQKGVKTYLKIEFLYPEPAIRSYLFYDPTLDIPRRPQTTDVERVEEDMTEGDRQMVLSTPEQNLLGLGEKPSRRAIAPREEWSAIFVKKDWVVEEIKEAATARSPIERSQSDRINSLESSNDIPLPLPSKKQIPISRPPENLYKKKTVQQRQELASIQVGRNFSHQVELYLQQWATFSQILPNNPQWELLIESNVHKLIDNLSKRTIVEYERNSQRLSAKSVRVLHTLLFETISNVASSNLVTRDQQSLAQRWLLQLRNPPLVNEQELLAFIFNL